MNILLVAIMVLATKNELYDLIKVRIKVAFSIAVDKATSEPFMVAAHTREMQFMFSHRVDSMTC